MTGSTQLFANFENGGGAPLTPRDPQDLAEIVLGAVANRRPLRPAGAGTWLDAGRPVHGATLLDLARFTGILDYTPGDLTLTARAATPLREIAHTARQNGQWLAIDPPGSLGGTLGATLATASAGPLSASIGLPRDVALGLEFVSGRGEVVRGGGRVVKNVAGFDLVRLQVGAWGTLGVLTEVTVRLRALPEVDRTVSFRIPNALEAIATLAARLRALPAPPLAAELLNVAAARNLQIALNDAPGVYALVRLGGNEDAVGAQIAAITTAYAATDHSVEVWSQFAALDANAATVVRYSDFPSALPSTWKHALAGAEADDTIAHANISRGIVRVARSDKLSPNIAEIAVGAAHTVIERTSAELWGRVPSAVSHRLSQGLADAFDPARVLNPGILGA